MKLGICVFFVFIANTVLAQESPRIVINGKINANSMDLEGVYVINLKTEKSTITLKDGYFSITATPGDTLLFSAIQLKENCIVLESNHFQEELFLVKMEANITILKEVVIKRYDNINAVTLGISSIGIKHLTQVEKKLYTAKSTAGDALLNFMSGRTAMLKKEVKVEKKWSYIQLIDNMFDQNHFVSILKIPLEYVKGFKYYAVENDKFTTILKTNNKTTTEFLMGELATKYIEIIASENE
ncbi:hypothetical protein [Flavobacterium franklandianum]|uniref:CarboxypepD_reg-like domain-containing protein n=1 Tax=Flavobacterium franklandianum TaxID=2594430 RepID=A0A553CQP3_9FLAO|nr:hypothetical protein [Flavobacterium franklandianum]TRX22819.1 hypothetical protein FNW17_03365 [Flavobacterium franklandianum]